MAESHWWENSQQVVGFFSYKGGVGRTVVLCNTALALVQAMRDRTDAEHGVFIADLDLHAPGVLPIFGLNVRKTDVFSGILDNRWIHQNIKDKAVQLSFADDSVPVYMLADLTPDRHAIELTHQLFGGEANPEALPNAIAYLRERGKEEFKAPITLIDLGSGYGELPRKAFSLLDQLVVVARADRQHRQALPNILRGLGGTFETAHRPGVHVVLNQLPAGWLQTKSEELSCFRDEAGLQTFLTENQSGEYQQVRTLACMPLITSALTQERVLFPKKWNYTDPDISVDVSTSASPGEFTTIAQKAQNKAERQMLAVVESLCCNILDWRPA